MVETLTDKFLSNSSQKFHGTIISNIVILLRCLITICAGLKTYVSLNLLRLLQRKFLSFKYNLRIAETLSTLPSRIIFFKARSTKGCLNSTRLGRPSNTCSADFNVTPSSTCSILSLGHPVTRHSMSSKTITFLQLLCMKL